MRFWAAMTLALMVAVSTLGIAVAIHQTRLSARLDATTEGTVTQSELAGRGQHFILTASFTVGQRRYFATKGSSDIGRTVRNTPVGARIPVFFDSSDPDNATLTPGGGALGDVATAAILVAATIAFACYAVFKLRK